MMGDSRGAMDAMEGNLDAEELLREQERRMTGRATRARKVAEDREWTPRAMEKARLCAVVVVGLEAAAVAMQSGKAVLLGQRGAEYVMGVYAEKRAGERLLDVISCESL